MTNPLLLLVAAAIALVGPIGFVVARSWERRQPVVRPALALRLGAKPESRPFANAQPSMMPAMAV